jgi:serine/threonine protein kinase
MHNDIKLENLFLADDGRLLADPFLADFEVACEFADAEAYRGFGTYMYFAPERYLPDRVFDGRSDVWALGVVVYEMASGDLPFSDKGGSGDLPFSDKRASAYRSAVLNVGAAPPARLQGRSPDLQSFVDMALTPDVENRPTAEEMRHHRFLAQWLARDLARTGGLDGALNPSTTMTGAPAT